VFSWRLLVLLATFACILACIHLSSKLLTYLLACLLIDLLTHVAGTSSEYVISVKAFNAAGEGLPIYETTFTREEPSK